MSETIGKEAILYTVEGDRVKCTACARYCKIPEGKIGLCGIRGNVKGKLRLFVYGKVMAGGVEPIEKKPVIHFQPGSYVFSIGTTGCNWLCQYCINYDISQRRRIEGIDMNPKDVIDHAIGFGCEGVAYTYNEPSIFMEFATDCGILAHKKGLFNVFVSNGYGTHVSVGMMNEFLDAITIDFKGNGERNFMRRYVGVPDPQPVFDTSRMIKSRTRIHLEITDLVVPQVGDDLESARKLAKFIYDELGPDMPIHFLRFYPDYKIQHLPETPVETLERHCKIARAEGLRYVYVGNILGHKWEHTYCPECNSIAVGRFGPFIVSWQLDDNNCCKTCGYPIPIIGRFKWSSFSR